MAYAGTTAGSTTTNPPLSFGPPALGGINANTTEAYAGLRVWLYNSSHSTTQLTDTAFFTDAYFIGMKQGDIVFGTQNTGSSVGVYMGVLGAVTTAGAALASTGGILSSTR